MYKVLFFAAFISSVVASPRAIPFNACNEGDVYRENCNSCICDETGVYICSRFACYQDEFNEQMQKTKDNDDEFTLPRLSRSKRSLDDDDSEEVNLPMLRFVAEKGGCLLGEVQNQDCNRCKCVGEKYGLGWICTTRECKTTNSEQKAE